MMQTQDADNRLALNAGYSTWASANARRTELVDNLFLEIITPQEVDELEKLQQLADAVFMQRIAAERAARTDSRLCG